MFVLKPVSCAQASPAKVCTESYCTVCGQVLYRTQTGGTIFTEKMRGAKCDCDWRCCQFSEQGAQKHMPHIANRPSSVEVTEFTCCLGE